MQSSRGMQIYHLIMPRKKANVFYLRNAVAALIAQAKKKKKLCPIKKAVDFRLYNSCGFSKLLLLFVAGTGFVWVFLFVLLCWQSGSALLATSPPNFLCIPSLLSDRAAKEAVKSLTRSSEVQNTIIEASYKPLWGRLTVFQPKPWQSCWNLAGNKKQYFSEIRMRLESKVRKEIRFYTSFHSRH